jgi:pSer/pThr/pTyr-binding forkhead associated (FHA) protein
LSNVKARLRVTEGRSGGAELALEPRGTYVLGRSSESDLQVRDRNVSRRHCRIEHDGEYFWLVDEASANGTFANGKPVRRYMLYDGDVIGLGRSRLVFELLDQEEDANSRGERQGA